MERVLLDAVRSFNIPVQNMKEAMDFYGRAFGWTFGSFKGSGGDYHWAMTVETDEDDVPTKKGAINGGLFNKGTHGIDTTFLEVEVRSIDESMAKVLENGGKLVRAKMPMHDFAYFAIVQDPDGNHLGLMEYKR
jgi:predicted enzyme related to lactoylglutathione lyase